MGCDSSSRRPGKGWVLPLTLSEPHTFPPTISPSWGLRSPHEEPSVGLRIRSGFENQLDPVCLTSYVPLCLSCDTPRSHWTPLLHSFTLHSSQGFFHFLECLSLVPDLLSQGSAWMSSALQSLHWYTGKIRNPTPCSQDACGFFYQGWPSSSITLHLWICLHLWTGSSLEARPSMATPFRTVSSVPNSLIHIGCITIIFQMNEWESKIL